MSTANLKRLLAEATPGPWRAEVGAAGVPEGWDEHWLALHMGHNSMYDVGREPPAEEEYANFKLAALAPQLAQEVLRMREELRELRDQLKKRSEHYGKVELSTDPLDGIQLEDNYAEDEISRILGDHDG
ncbi:hypothetical protein cauri_2015 [Corynebacterium aurimucosum ATCC 700975]|uniref:Uncharacterized protein n=1 Tax=Corynebacterium aurimucosum (strain ATCC 700975 / DSM 44827 / CIP 107346 / CN-1) TaxID=548476 RepID=C3PIF4_CORA7|nr:hypothetical protein cauri_2015 [Corynebacterium aurimucosum ATCC 700975]